MAVLTSLAAAAAAASAAAGVSGVMQQRKQRKAAERAAKRQETAAREAAALETAVSTTGADIELGAADEETETGTKRKSRQLSSSVLAGGVTASSVGGL